MVDLTLTKITTAHILKTVLSNLTKLKKHIPTTTPMLHQSFSKHKKS